ncbi:MAG: hypothetical protein ACKO0M_06090 [Cyanobium sp.]
MDSGNWQIGCREDSLDDLLGDVTSACSLWFLAGYLKGLREGGLLEGDMPSVLLEPDGVFSLQRGDGSRASRAALGHGDGSHGVAP